MTQVRLILPYPSTYRYSFIREPSSRIFGRKVLLKNLLYNQTGISNIPLTSPSVLRASPSLPQLKEMKVSITVLGAGKNTTGKHKIPITVLRPAWPQLSKLVVDLFRDFTVAGNNPQCFLIALFAIIYKLTKAELLSPRSY